MNAEPKAVFLSYASQDAEAAKRICDTLRSAGVEVWFDQNELVGGDAWDAKIRKQIAECALFVPIISVNTQARTEGYFRLEWKLAAQRTHMIADDAAFLLPVVIDETRDAEARVPAEFKAVQWSRIGSDEALRAFRMRIQKLLGGSPLEAGPSAGAVGLGKEARTARRGGSTPPPSKPSRPWLLPVLGALGAVIALAIWQPWKKAGPAAAADRSGATLTEAQKLVRQARALLDDDPMQLRENHFLADELAQRAVKADPTDGEAWAIAGRASALMVRKRFDASPARKEQARMQVERAMSLAPNSTESALAQAIQQEVAGRLADAERILLELTKRTPADWRLWDALGELSLKAKRVEAALDYFRKAQALSGGDSRPSSGEVRALLRLGRLAEAKAKLDRLMTGKPGRAAYLTGLLFYSIYTYDISAAKAFIEKLPSRVRQEDAVISTLAEFFLRTGEGDRALEELKSMPRDFFEDGWDWRPKGYLAGYAHQVAGRPTAAQAEWRQALAVVEKRLAVEPNESLLLHWRSVLQALVGQVTEARAGRKLLRELEKAENGWFDSILQVVIGDREEAIQALVLEWPNAEFSLRNDLWGDWLFAPWYAAIRDDPRIRGLALEHKAAIDRALDRAPPAAKEDKSVAVLAFANLSDDKANEFFSDGISEELLNVLAKVPGLKVSARTSAFHFKGKNTPTPEIARQLGVAYVVDGSVRKMGNQVRITAQLIKAADGFHVWSDNFNRELKDIFAVQDEIAGLIAKSLSLQLGAGAVAGAGTSNPEVLQLYLDARRAWNLRTVEGAQRATELLERALGLDPGFARAHAGLADVIQVSADETEANAWLFGWIGSPTYQRMLSHARRALALDPNCAEAHAALGGIYAEWRPAEAVPAFRRALELNPNYATAHHWLASALVHDGRMNEALLSVARAAELDPLSHRIHDNFARWLRFAGRYEAALAEAERALAIQADSTQARVERGCALVALGRVDEGLPIIMAAVKDNPYLASFALGDLKATGRNDELRRYINEIRPRANALFTFNAHIALGEIDRALEPGARDVLGEPLALLFSTLYDPVRADPRWLKMMTEVGMADAHARAQAWRKANPPETGGQKREDGRRKAEAGGRKK